ncbi:MAG TPA: phospholipid scramblase-related protein [Thermoanaerobaculia bacterium]|nr:phospholipid scramblase-related protein [Thermoanaerobaculia bacterium]
MPVCPQCGHRQDGGAECTRCGVVFAKWRSSPRSSRAAEEADQQFTPLHALLDGADVLRIDQHGRNWWEVLFDWEQRNQYAVTDGMHRHRGWVVEQGLGFAAALARILLRSHRPLEMYVFAPDDQHIALQIRRPFFFFFSEMEVSDGERRIGMIRRRFGLLRRIYDLHDAADRPFARIVSPFFRIWTFPVLDSAGNHVAEISKKWKGLMREAFTDADKFTIDFLGGRWDIERRAVVFAAALSIDFDFFEDNQRR